MYLIQPSSFFCETLIIAVETSQYAHITVFMVVVVCRSFSEVAGGKEGGGDDDDTKH